MKYYYVAGMGEVLLRSKQVACLSPGVVSSLGSGVGSLGPGGVRSQVGPGGLSLSLYYILTRARAVRIRQVHAAHQGVMERCSEGFYPILTETPRITPAVHL